MSTVDDNQEQGMEQMWHWLIGSDLDAEGLQAAIPGLVRKYPYPPRRPPRVVPAVQVYAVKDDGDFDFPPLRFPHAVHVEPMTTMRISHLSGIAARIVQQLTTQGRHWGIAGLNKSGNYRLWRPFEEGDRVVPDYPWAGEVRLTRVPHIVPGQDYPVDAP